MEPALPPPPPEEPRDWCDPYKNICGNDAKFMAGLQYDDITAGGSDVFCGWTTFLAFRTFFQVTNRTTH